MGRPRKRRFYQGLRFKLLLVSLTILVVPWVGYRYISETEGFLRTAHEQSLTATAQALGANLASRPELFSATGSTSTHGFSGPDLFLHELRYPLQLDGYVEDWSSLAADANTYPDAIGKTKIRALAGEQDGALYLMLEVTDPRVVYCDATTLPSRRCDYVLLALLAPDGQYRSYRITTATPGWVSVNRTDADDDTNSPRSDIAGEWEESGKGYNLELRIDRDLVDRELSFAVADTDRPGGEVTFHGPGRQSLRQNLGLLVSPSHAIHTLLEQSPLDKDVRVRVTDHNGFVVAGLGQPGTLHHAPYAHLMPSFLQALYELVLQEPGDLGSDYPMERTRLDSPAVRNALAGQANIRRQPTKDHNSVIVASTYPIRTTRGVVGAVMVEQTTDAILSLQNDALKRLFALTFGLFLMVMLLLLGYATLLTRRIRRLDRQIDQAVSDEGRILSSISDKAPADELGDLHRSFAKVLARLRDYNQYLEAMASRLAHELRTPLSVIKTSLESMEATGGNADNSAYLDRARQGTERMLLILNRMREASRLEQTFHSATRERLNLHEFLPLVVDGYRAVYSQARFELALPEQSLWVEAAPELISQALDNLISNAVDFHRPDTPIRLAVEALGRQVELALCNKGPLLPEGMGKELFQSMISLREQGADTPHLGLGLYLVRLIAEFHGGSVRANNQADGSGMCFSVILPASH